MQNPEEKNINNELEEKSKNNESLKVWKTPEIKVLPVPTRTQGGPNVGQPEVTSYRPS